MDREPHDPYDPEHELDPDEEREVPLDDDVELELPPPTLDPEERVEEEPLDDPGLDDARPL